MALTREQFESIKQDLDRDGYVVIKGLVSAEKATALASDFWSYVEGLSKFNQIDRNDPKTWRGDHWPQTIHGIFKHFGIGQEEFVWKAREDPGVISFYERMWNTNDLLTSFDGANLTVPTTAGTRKNWAHFDQGAVLKMTRDGGQTQKETRDFWCVQGLLNLRPCGDKDGGFTCYKGSHSGHAKFWEDKGATNNGYMTNEEREAHGYLTAGEKKKKAELKERAKTDENVDTSAYFDAETRKRWKDFDQNWYKMDASNEVDAAFLAKHPRVKVNAEPGDFIVWYSRTLHYAEGISTQENPDPAAHRMCIYVSMLPRAFSTPKELKRRADYLDGGRTTSHWACIKLDLNAEKPRTYGNDSRIDNFVVPDIYHGDPEARPLLNATRKKLAGVPLHWKYGDSDAFKKKQERANGPKRANASGDKKRKRDDNSTTSKKKMRTEVPVKQSPLWLAAKNPNKSKR